MARNKITIHDIAVEAGVSAATVSRVLTGKAPVSGETRERVSAVLQKYSYQPSSAAAPHPARHSKSIGFIVPDITNPFFSKLFQQVERKAAREGYTVILCDSNCDFERESAILKVLLNREAEAIVFTGGRVDSVSAPRKAIAELERVNRSVPLITCSQLPGAKCIQLLNNERQGIFAILQHLADLGHRSVGMVGGDLRLRPSVQRRQYLLEAAEMYSMQMRREWFVESNFTVSSGSDSMEQILSHSCRPTAVVAFNDVVAAGALGAMLRHGVSVPGDMALTGYDGNQYSEVLTPAITTASYDYEGYANKIVEIVKDAPVGQISETMFDMTLLVRESTAGPARESPGSAPGRPAFL